MDSSNLWKRDESIDSKLEKLSLASIPKQIDYEKVKFSHHQEVKPLYRTAEDYDLRDLGIEAQLQKISKNSIKEVFGWKPQKIKSAVTEEMIKKYQDEVANTNYEDPITGKIFKYIPSNTDIELEQKHLYQLPLPQEIEDFKTEYYQNIEYVKQLEQEILRLQDERYYLNIDPSVKQIDLDKIDNRIQQLNEGVILHEFEATKLKRKIDDYPRQLSENQAETERVNRYNTGLLKSRSDELNLLNRGKLNLTQQIGESDEEFRQRLLDVGQVTVEPDVMEDNAKLRQAILFKKNMKEILSDVSLIENVLKIASSNSFDPIFEYNKYWVSLKKNFIDVYGINNENVSSNDIINFFDNVIGKVSFQNQTIEAKAEQQPIFISRAELSSQLPMFNGKTPYQLQAYELNKIFKKKYISEHNGNYPLSSQNPKVEDVRKLYHEAGYYPSKETYALKTQPQITELFSRARPVGSGLKQLPTKALFGRIMINPHSLYYKNILVILDRNGKHLVGMPNVRVSDSFAKIILDILEDKPIHLPDLSLDEKHLYDNLLYLAGLHKKHDNSLQHTRQNMKHRLELLEGEIAAGNTNPELKKELHHLLAKMAHGGLINHKQAKDHFRRLTKHFK